MNEPVVLLSALEHYCYCPRQCALIVVDGVWRDNAHIVRGQRGHRRVDTPESRTERGSRVFRSIPVFSEKLGLSGRADLIEVSRAGVVTPVEYKMGSRHGDAADVQLCATALCLEEMLDVAIDSGQLWFGHARRRVPIALDASLRTRTREVIESVRSLSSSSSLPDAPNDARCTQCQLIDHCLPGLVAERDQVVAYFRREVLECES